MSERSGHAFAGCWAQVRIYALPEVASILMPVSPPPPCASVLEARFQAGLRYACAWAQNPNIACALCGEPLSGRASYLAVMMPLDERWGLGTSSAVCVKCGERPRDEVLKSVEYAALLMFGPEGGHA